MQTIINSKEVSVHVESESDRAAVRRILSGAKTESTFVADLLEWAGVSGLYVAPELAGGVDVPVVTDIPLAEEDGTIGVGVWAYQGAEAMGERLLRQGQVALMRLQ